MLDAPAWSPAATSSQAKCWRGRRYGRADGGTSYHLHFDAQVPTRNGWVFINPYMTLVAAYERLIGGRGQVVNDAMFATPRRHRVAADGGTAAALRRRPQIDARQSIALPEIGSEPAARARSQESAEHCTTVVIAASPAVCAATIPRPGAKPNRAMTAFEQASHADLARNAAASTASRRDRASRRPTAMPVGLLARLRQGS